MAGNKGVVEGVTEERARELIAEAVKGLVSEERVRELIGEQFFPSGRLAILGEDLAGVQLDPAWLEGLTFSEVSRQQPKSRGERPVLSVTVRPMTEEDVLGFAVGEESVTLVDRAGQKHIVRL